MLRRSILAPVAMAFLLCFTLAACDSADVAGPDNALVAATSTYGKTTRGILPTKFEGNFVASDDDDVCYEMERLGHIGYFDAEMRGFKVDIPGVNTNSFISTTLTNGGRELNWATRVAGTRVLGFIIKGGPSYNVYDYITQTGIPAFKWSDIESDNKLISPLHGRNTPGVSHYNGCYYEPPPPNGKLGCTPGYWRNHADRWLGVQPSNNFDDAFGLTSPYLGDVTLGQAISAPQTYGTFAFHAVAALLNAQGGVPNADGTKVDYKYTKAQVIEMVQDAVAPGDDRDARIQATKNLFAAANEAGCPLSGTKADRIR